MNYLNKILCLFLTLLLSFSVFAQSENVKITVAADGTGDFTSIQEAINSCKAFRNFDQIIYIKKGIYKEKILIDSYLTNIHLIGEDVSETIITQSDYAGMPGIGTFNSYTVKVLGDSIYMENLTIENAAGRVGQAVALHVEGDLFQMKNCRLLGNQDTLYAAGTHSRQRFSDCYIEGTTDYIFGSATVLFERCELHSKVNSYITAANTPQGCDFGYVFKNCRLTASEEATEVYLGRPWRDFAKVVYINCEMGGHIRPEGWHNWSQPNREKTTFYAEFKSIGDGAKPNQRVSWSNQLSEKEVKKYTIENIFSYCEKWPKNQ